MKIHKYVKICEKCDKYLDNINSENIKQIRGMKMKHLNEKNTKESELQLETGNVYNIKSNENIDETIHGCQAQIISNFQNGKCEVLIKNGPRAKEKLIIENQYLSSVLCMFVCVWCDCGQYFFLCAFFSVCIHAWLSNKLTNIVKKLK